MDAGITLGSPFVAVTSNYDLPLYYIFEIESALQTDVYEINISLKFSTNMIKSLRVIGGKIFCKTLN